MKEFRRRRRRPGVPDDLESLAARQFPEAELVLLCSFGPDPSGTRTGRELRRALLLAGYRGNLATHLMSESTVLEQFARDSYSLRTFGA